MKGGITMNRKNITFFSYTLFVTLLLSLCLLFSMKVNAEDISIEKAKLSTEGVVIEGVRYYLDVDDGTAEATIETTINPESPNGSIPSEVTVHNQVTYDGKTYTVRDFDISHDVNSEVEGMIIREPSTLWYHQKYLKKLTIESGIFTLNMGFSNYMSLEEVIFEDPKDMERCGLYFYNCPNLKDIYIPADINVLPRLRKCPNTTVTFAPNHPKYQVINGDIYSKNGEILYDVPNGSKDYKVKKTVKRIELYAFYGNDNIKNINLPSSVKKVEQYAFGDMKKLKSIKLSKNMKAAKPYLFRRSKKLKKLTFPKNIRKISAYYGGNSLSGLKKIYIKAPKLKKVDLTGIPSKCTIYVKNTTVRNQIRKSGFNGRIVVQR